MKQVGTQSRPEHGVLGKCPAVLPGFAAMYKSHAVMARQGGVMRGGYKVRFLSLCLKKLRADGRAEQRVSCRHAQTACRALLSCAVRCCKARSCCCTCAESASFVAVRKLW